MATFSFDSFAAWALPLRSNTTRGLAAEYLVAHAVGGDLSQPRDEWGNHDTVTADGITVEVKSGAYLQAWTQSAPSTIVYTGLRGKWLGEQGIYLDGPREYRSQAYVFAAHTTTDPDRYDALDPGQWEFRVLGRSRLVALNQDSISLTRLQQLHPEPIAYRDLSAAVRDVSFA
ncbi:hypothetical protein SAMN04487905_101283 [Actinopolyspora xinjiangensis]|uniref:Uncharacterized protein n=1 Tax=Actinopolyspora xinjiangensis TaxID=405564 RepID=A0A1H0NWZ0_9ACTN|nr:hypothetical protein [Actinopolyspora xinjiangensis]SDO96890.1 hypothetical protein SAMN04487905_101283 [Actinopolyspora xinjiangensis]